MKIQNFYTWVYHFYFFLEIKKSNNITYRIQMQHLLLTILFWYPLFENPYCKFLISEEFKSIHWCMQYRTCIKTNCYPWSFYRQPKFIKRSWLLKLISSWLNLYLKMRLKTFFAKGDGLFLFYYWRYWNFLPAHKHFLHSIHRPIHLNNTHRL